MKQLKEYELYNIYINDDIVLHEIFGYEVKAEIAFLNKMYTESGRIVNIEIRVAH